MSETVTVRVTTDEKNMAIMLAKYLHARKRIESPTMSEAMRLSLYFIVGEVLKSIESERIGAAKQ